MVISRYQTIHSENFLEKLQKIQKQSTCTKVLIYKMCPTCKSLLLSCCLSSPICPICPIWDICDKVNNAFLWYSCRAACRAAASCSADTSPEAILTATSSPRLRSIAFMSTIGGKPRLCGEVKVLLELPDRTLLLLTLLLLLLLLLLPLLLLLLLESLVLCLLEAGVGVWTGMLLCSWLYLSCSSVTFLLVLWDIWENKNLNSMKKYKVCLHYVIIFKRTFTANKMFWLYVSEKKKGLHCTVNNVH